MQRDPGGLGLGATDHKTEVAGPADGGWAWLRGCALCQMGTAGTGPGSVFLGTLSRETMMKLGATQRRGGVRPLLKPPMGHRVPGLLLGGPGQFLPPPCQLH